LDFVKKRNLGDLEKVASGALLKTLR